MSAATTRPPLTYARLAELFAAQDRERALVEALAQREKAATPEAASDADPEAGA